MTSGMPLFISLTGALQPSLPLHDCDSCFHLSLGINCPEPIKRGIDDDTIPSSNGDQDETQETRVQAGGCSPNQFDLPKVEGRSTKNNPNDMYSVVVKTRKPVLTGDIV